MNLYDAIVQVYSCEAAEAFQFPHMSFSPSKILPGRGLELEKHPLEHGYTTRLTWTGQLDQHHLTSIHVESTAAVPWTPS